MNKIRYRNIKLKNIDGFLVVRLTSEDSGLPYDILLDSLGKNDIIPDCPRVGVIVGDNVIPVQISDEAIILSEHHFEDCKRITEWITKHREVLMKHWHRELCR